MTTEPKHTPTPWNIHYEQDGQEWAVITDSNGNIIANVNSETGPDIPPLVSVKMPHKSNAAHIVHCVNSHESLTGLVGELVEALRNSNIEIKEQFSHTLNLSSLSRQMLELRYQANEAILTKAKALQPAAGE